MVIIKWQSKL